MAGDLKFEFRGQTVVLTRRLAMVLGAVVLGGVLAWSRPWRWILKPALFAGLLAQLSAKLVAQVPLQSWMSLVTAFAQGRGNTGAAFDAQAPSAAKPAPDVNNQP